MRVIKGSLKGRNISCPPGIRPVALKVRKACFDILGDEVKGARVLDLFAGSGALGIEALSAGAREAVFVDSSKACIDNLNKNIRLFKLQDRAEVHLKQASRAVADFCQQGGVFDLIFLDPPYYKGLIIKILQDLEVYDIVAPFGYIVGFCYAKDEFLENSSKYPLLVNKKYGQTNLLIYNKDD